MIETTGIILKERAVADLNGDDPSPFVPTNELAIAKLVTNEQLIEEERSLQKVETSVENKYHGIRGYLRLFQISRVITMLSLYLYLDQYDVHHKHQLKRAAARLETAAGLTRSAVYGEKLYGVRLWFLDAFTRFARLLIVFSADFVRED